MGSLSGGITAPLGVGLYEKFEATFQINTSATVNYWPYDASPACNTSGHPNAVPSGLGVSVDGLFLAPGLSNWNSAVVQPAFYYQDYQTYPGDPDHTLADGNLWRYPKDSPTWMLRFAPSATGTWAYKVRVTDSSGSTTSASGSFECSGSSSHGFVEVSETDSKFFQLSDGTYVPFVGVSSMDIADAANLGVNLIREWWQGSSTITPLFGTSGQGGDPMWHIITYDKTQTRLPGDLVSVLLETNKANAWDNTYQYVPCLPYTDYRLSAWVKCVGMSGTGNYGAFVGEDFTHLTSTPSHPSAWTQITLDFNSGNRSSLRIYIGTANVTAGSAYCSDFSLKEYFGGGAYGSEIAIRSRFQAHSAYPESIAWYCDTQADLAADNNVYLKVVIEEKQDGFFGNIQEDGTWGDLPLASWDANLYANATHASRIYQQYFWRYLIARYGYCTAIHSFELFNEGDPTDSTHWDALAALGAYFQTNDPNAHLCTSSNWFNLPPLMWTQTEAGYADIHQYTGSSLPSGGKRIWPGWDGAWFVVNNADENNLGTGCVWDTDVKKSGSRSLKMTITHAASFAEPNHSNLFFVCRAVPGHTIQISGWVNGSNLVSYDQGWNPYGAYLHALYKVSGDDWAGWPDHPDDTFGVPWGTTDWTQQTVSFVVPTVAEAGWDGVPQMLWLQPRLCTTNSGTDGTAWFDDIVVTDLTTGIVLNYNGGFEEITAEGYDIAAAHRAYSAIIAGYQLGKPVVRGETGICYPQRYASPYKGYTKNTEMDQALIDDTDGVWWRKWVWSHCEPNGLLEIYWWPNLIVDKGFTHGSAFQAFMSGIPLSNGNYEDVGATVSDAKLRICGMKDLVNNKAHMWIDNAPYTWKAVVDNAYSPLAWSSGATYQTDSTCASGGNIYTSLQDSNTNHALSDAAWWTNSGASGANPDLPASVSGTVTVTGLASGDYTLEWWDTTSGVVTSTGTATSTSGESLTFTVTGLASDIAARLYPAEGSQATPPAAPSDLSASGVSSGAVNLAWTDNASDETGFRIQKALASGATYSQIADVSADTESYQDTDVSPLTSYWYRLYAYNAAGNSAFCSIASATTLAGPTPPNVPSGLTATVVSDAEIDLAWTDTSNNETGFHVYRALSAGGAYAEVAALYPDVNTWVDSTVESETTYFYKLTAYNDSGDSDYSNVASGTTTVTPAAPAAPTDLAASAPGSNTVSLTWTDNSDNETGFVVERGLNITGPFSHLTTLGAGVTSYSDTDVVAGVAYYYRVYAYNATGNSGYTGTAGAVPSGPSAGVLTGGAPPVYMSFSGHGPRAKSRMDRTRWGVPG